ncbi:MAG: hypothetical protein SF052_06155 [Bacteroidia bacterium]|nr:hypothetical protein [Bacteroidia bacterium]
MKASIQKIEEVPYMPPLSGDGRYWKIVKKGKRIIPLLISLLDDTTMTNAHVRFWGGDYTVGDISLALFEEIIANFKVNDFILHHDPQYDCPLNITSVYWCFVRSAPLNRTLLKQWVQAGYASYADSLIWCQDTNLYFKRDFRLPSPVPEGEEEIFGKKREASNHVPKRYPHPARGFYLIKNAEYENFIEMKGCKCE